MPDAWEDANGLNKNSAADGSVVASNGYTNVENYINSLVANITDAQNAGGTMTGDTEKKPENTQEEGYEISAETSLGNWNFTNGFSITSSKEYAAVSNSSYIKFSRNTKYTINIPDGITIEKVTITGNLNQDSGTGYLAELNGQTFAATDYVFPSRTANDDKTYTIVLETPATNTLTFTPSGDGQVGWKLMLYTSANEPEEEQTITKTVTGTITLPFYDGSTDFAINYDENVIGKVTATVSLGSALGCSTKRIVNGANFNEISTTEANAQSANSANALTITITTANKDLTFKPTNIAFNACKIGTDGGKFDLNLDGSVLYSGEAPNRNSETGGYYSSYNNSLSSTSATSHSFVYNIYALKDKNMGLGNIVITGELTEKISHIIGDVNSDGLVNITDVVCLVNYVLDSDASNINLEVSDINGDGDINITDVVSLVNIILVQHE